MSNTRERRGYVLRVIERTGTVVIWDEEAHAAFPFYGNADLGLKYEDKVVFHTDRNEEVVEHCKRGPIAA